eukprot:1832487-Rhodomonas_salina.2
MLFNFLTIALWVSRVAKPVAAPMATYLQTMLPTLAPWQQMVPGLQSSKMLGIISRTSTPATPSACPKRSRQNDDDCAAIMRTCGNRSRSRVHSVRPLIKPMAPHRL